jgi:hypothetical protein
MSKENPHNSSGSAAWAWTTLGIVFIVFYFGSGSSRRDSDRESSEQRRSKRSSSSDRIIVDSDPRSSRVRVEDEAANLAVEVNAPSPPASPEPQQNFQSQAFSESMRWLNRSMDTLGEKLKKISEKIENTEDKAIVEEEIKRAFREAFVQDRTAQEQAQVALAQAQAATEQQSGQGEVKDAQAFEQIALTTPEEEGDKRLDTSAHHVDRPILGEGVPDWIRVRIVEGDRILVPIESSMHATLAECREELNAKLPQEVKQILDIHVLKNASSDSIAELNDEYIRDKLVDRTLEFDNYQERPSGNFHQLWVRMDVEKKEIEQIRDWEREIVTQDRVWQLGGLSAFAIGSMAGLSGIVSLLSRREEKKNQQRRPV